MLPVFDADGQVCKMLIERHSEATASETTLELGTPISDELIDELLDEIVPLASRGKELNDPRGFIDGTIAGGVVTIKHVYEHVIVTVYGTDQSESTRNLILTITWRDRPCAPENAQMPKPASSVVGQSSSSQTPTPSDTDRR
jgi:hypothetical protein